jgi:hypothetical protein
LIVGLGPLVGLFGHLGFGLSSARTDRDKNRMVRRLEGEFPSHVSSHFARDTSETNVSRCPYAQ